MTAEVQLAGDLGYGITWLVQTLVIVIIVATAFFVYVALSTKSRRASLAGFDRLKYQLHKYNAERYWAVFVAGVLIWFWVLGYPWMPPVAFSNAVEDHENIRTIKITAGQWFWALEDAGSGTGPATSQPITSQNSGSDWFQSSETASSSTSSASEGSSSVTIKAGETVKFVARSQDVNHGFGILSSSDSMDTPVMQMQVIPGYENVFYFTFGEPGTYTIRCLEYCGWNHPFMTTQLTIEAR